MSLSKTSALIKPVVLNDGESSFEVKETWCGEVSHIDLAIDVAIKDMATMGVFMDRDERASMTVEDMGTHYLVRVKDWE